MSVDKNGLQEIKSLLDKSGIDSASKRLALAAIWTQDELPDIESNSQYEDYKRIQSELEAQSPPKQTVERSKWHHTDQGILWGAYAIKIHQWEEQQARKPPARNR